MYQVPSFPSNYHGVRVKKLQKEFAIGVSVRLILTEQQPTRTRQPLASLQNSHTPTTDRTATNLHTPAIGLMIKQQQNHCPPERTAATHTHQPLASWLNSNQLTHASHWSHERTETKPLASWENSSDSHHWPPDITAINSHTPAVGLLTEKQSTHITAINSHTPTIGLPT